MVSVISSSWKICSRNVDGSIQLFCKFIRDLSWDIATAYIQMFLQQCCGSRISASRYALSTFRDDGTPLFTLRGTKLPSSSWKICSRNVDDLIRVFCKFIRDPVNDIATAFIQMFLYRWCGSRISASRYAFSTFRDDDAREVLFPRWCRPEKFVSAWFR